MDKHPKHETTEPCCGTCVHWQGKSGHEWCGRYLVLVERDKPSGMEKGAMLPVEAQELVAYAQWEYLRPRSHFVCEQWRSAANETLLDPERFPPESHGYRLEQNELIDKATTDYAAELQRASIDVWAPAPAERKRARVNQTLLQPVERKDGLWLEATG